LNTSTGVGSSLKFGISITTTFTVCLADLGFFSVLMSDHFYSLIYQFSGVTMKWVFKVTQ